MFLMPNVFSDGSDANVSDVSDANSNLWFMVPNVSDDASFQFPMASERHRKHRIGKVLTPQNTSKLRARDTPGIGKASERNNSSINILKHQSAIWGSTS